MTIIIVDKTLLNAPIYSVTGGYSLTLRIACFYQQPSDKTMQYLPEKKGLIDFTASVTGGFIDTYKKVAIQIPIDRQAKLATS